MSNIQILILKCKIFLSHQMEKNEPYFDTYKYKFL